MSRGAVDGWEGTTRACMIGLMSLARRQWRKAETEADGFNARM